MLCRIGFIGACCLLTWSAALSAADDDAAALQKVVDGSVNQFVKAFDKRDVEAIAALFTPEAEYIHPDGTVFHGRDAIAAEFAALFANGDPTAMEVDVTSIRPVAAGVLIEEGVSTFKPQDPSQPSSRARYAAMHVKQSDGTWLLASVRELEEPQVTPNDRLQPLAWLVGDWRDESSNRVISTNWKWSGDGSFLVGEFSVQGSEANDVQGTHRIGWDPQRAQLRSWIFESGGVFAEGTWSSKGPGGWALQSSGVLASGESTSSVFSFTLDGTDAIAVVQSQRVIAGAAQPDRKVRIVRQPPKPSLAESQK